MLPDVRILSGPAPGGLACWPSSLCLSVQLQEEAVLEGHFFQVFETARSTTMASFHIGLQQQQVIIRFQIPEFGHPFGRFPVLYLRVVQSGCHQQVGISLCLDIIVWLITEHVFITIPVIRITPFIEFPSGQRDIIIQHGSHHIHEGYGSDDTMVKLRP